MGRFTVVGIGPGDASYLLPAASEAIAEADTLLGAPRHLALYESSGKTLLGFDSGIDAALDEIAARKERESVALLLSGDPCFFSLLGRVSERFSPAEYRVVPGIGSFQLLFSRLGIPWNDVILASLHGRPLERAADMIREGRRTLFLLDGTNTAPAVASFLLRMGLPDRGATYAERLGYTDERIVGTTLSEVSRTETGDPLSMLLLDAGPVPRAAAGVYPDEWFVRSGGIPLSKEVVRSLVVSALSPIDGLRVLEIGTGTGGITVELARRIGSGTVYAVERFDEAIDATRANLARAAAAHRVRLIRGSAPDAIRDVPPVHRAVIGGHGGGIGPILDAAWDRLSPGGRLLATANMPSTADRAFAALKRIGASPRVIHAVASHSSEVGDSWMLRASNPFFLVIADKTEAKA
jgi:precorrin-6Y C5,15-methyltransferase (decarboxylating)